MSSDRTQLKQDLASSLSSSRTVVDGKLCAAQDAQRFHLLQTGAAGVAANANNVVLPGPVLDRPMDVKTVRICPGGSYANTAGAMTVSYGYIQDANANANFVTMGSITDNTVANSGTGSWVFGASILVTPNALVPVTVPAGSFMAVKLAGQTTALPPTTFQILGEEV